MRKSIFLFLIFFLGGCANTSAVKQELPPVVSNDPSLPRALRGVDLSPELGAKKISDEEAKKIPRRR